MTQVAPWTPLIEGPDLFGYDTVASRRQAAALTKWRKIWIQAGIRIAHYQDDGYRDGIDLEPKPGLAEDWITSHPNGAVLTLTEGTYHEDRPGLGDLAVIARDRCPSVDNQSVRRILEIQDDLFGNGRTLMLGPALPRRQWPKALRQATALKPLRKSRSQAAAQATRSVPAAVACKRRLRAPVVSR